MIDYRGHRLGTLTAVSTTVVLHVPTGSRLRQDAPLPQLKLAVARALISQMTAPGDWHELALLVDAEQQIVGHPRLLRGLTYGNEDYTQCVHQVVPAALGLRTEEDGWYDVRQDVYLDHLVDIEDHLDLPVWLAEHEPRLHRLLYGVDAAEAAALDAVTDAIADLELPEIVRQLDRLRRDLADDLPAAIGHAKELVESACKTIIGQTGPGAGSDFPALVTAALHAVGRHAKQVDQRDPDAQLLKRLFGALQSQLEAIAGLRNRVGTGHGRAGDVSLDAPLARLVIGQTLQAVAYLLHAADLNTINGGTLDEQTAVLVIDGGTL
jgi:hypothetical protein